MKIIILGVGKVGETLVESFLKEGHDVTVIDTNEKRVSYVVNKYDANGIVGGGLEHEILADAGASDTDFFIACTSRDETNILCCVLAKKLGAKRTIARVRDPQYYSEMDNLREYLGLDLAFNPEYRAAMDILSVLKFPSANSVESFAGGRALMVEFDIAKDNPINGKSLMQISAELGLKLLICMVKRGDTTIIPKGDFVLQEDDGVYIIATEHELTVLCKKLKIFKPQAKTAFLIGGGKLAYYLATELNKEGVSVKIMENDKNRCEELSEELPFATILYGDGTDQSVLDEERIKDFDACVTLTGIDEENIIISLFAKQNGVDKVVTKVDRDTMTDMVHRLGLDTVISPRISISDHIVKFVRSQGESNGAGMNALYQLTDNAEAIDFTLNNQFGGLGVPLSKLKIKKDVLIGGIVRGNEFILPVGSTVLEEGDRVIVVTSEKKITEPNGILQ